jgi:glucans biosynthesis protein C
MWWVMSILNVWRIPLLFFVSGMGVYFAMQSRTPMQLIYERARRILIPYIFGIFAIVPLGIMIWQSYNGTSPSYIANPGHLWFLGNIYAYVIAWVLVFVAINKNGAIIKRIFSTPLGLLIVIAAMVAEVLIVKPIPYELYAMTPHGFFLGLIAFFFGYVFAFTGTAFWDMITKWSLIIVVVAVGLAMFRLNGVSQPYLLPVESTCWILIVLVLGYKFLNKPSTRLSYLSEAAYPVYILHMIFQNLGSALLFPLEIPAAIKLPLLILFTLTGCLLTYEFVVRRTLPTRVLFGLRPQTKPAQQ